ncbi:36634_t:CDS:2 [Racocetra persica]|uniref:36634_t:CDS:1 n=1 Tax=Racocetra persica TaxID=160502 RepID=A0ACA9KBQ3_9GLOM|nr:36634_t:CDS:2 [Racocetra persica]
MANRIRAKKIRKATDALQSLNEDFDSILEFIYNNKKKEDILKLLNNMRYLREKNEGKIIFLYLQQQLVKVISNSLYRPQDSYSALKEEYDHLWLQNKKLTQKNEALIKKIKSFRSQNRHFKQKILR